MTIKVFDFFSGCGGTSQGFKNAGMDIIFALDNDRHAALTFKKNFSTVHFCSNSILEVELNYIEPLIRTCKDDPILFCGCAPCQPFTKQNTSKPIDDKRFSLLNEFRKFVAFYLPDYVFIENVPGMQRFKKKDNPFNSFLRWLEENEYNHRYEVVSSQSYGVPQKRKRLVLIASRLNKLDFPLKTHGPGTKKKFSSVRDWIGELPPINAGERHSQVPNHEAANLSLLNLKRINSTPEGGGRMDWPKELFLDCHKSKYKGHTDVYGRMRWDEPSTGLTTRCISLSNGRFGHPSQNRAISVREAACLQTFPMDFVFSGGISSIAKQIGNAVPVKLAEVFGVHINKHFLNQSIKKTDGKIQN